MNCLHFQNVVHDLVRETAMDTRTWDDAHTHAARCVNCAKLLTDARSLAAALGAVARAADEEQAPPALEMRLIEAFRKEHKAQPVFQVFRQRRRWAGAAIAAAVVLVALGLAALHREGGKFRPKPAGSDGASEAVTAHHENPSAARNLAVPLITQREPEAAQPVSRSLASRERARLRRSVATGRKATVETLEVATDFFPLPEAEGARDLDSGELVRVELPRSALAYLGLPVTGDPGGQTVTADVLIGEDGLAQAVRLVR